MVVLSLRAELSQKNPELIIHFGIGKKSVLPLQEFADRIQNKKRFMRRPLIAPLPYSQGFKLSSNLFSIHQS